MLRLTYHSLFYNSLTSFHTIVDTMMEPLFWCVDHLVRYLGPVRLLLSVSYSMVSGRYLGPDCALSTDG